MKRRALLLVEGLIMLAAAALLVLVLSKLLVDALRVQRSAAEHAQRTAVMDSMLRYLRRDLRAASAYEWDGRTLSLRSPGWGGRVEYELTTERAVRRDCGTETGAWAAERLALAFEVEHGPAGDMLYAAWIELPPPRRTELPEREFAVSLTLPRAAQRRVHGGGQP